MCVPVALLETSAREARGRLPCLTALYKSVFIVQCVCVCVCVCRVCVPVALLETSAREAWGETSAREARGEHQQERHGEDYLVSLCDVRY